MTPILTIYCLGRFEFYYQAGPQSERQLLPKPPTAKAQSLLAYLAQRRGQSHPRERLVGMFWGDRPARKARRSLSTALWQIRRCFPGGEGLDTNVRTVQIRFPGDLWLDVEAFEASAARDDAASLETAVSLYQSDFLDGFYDDWIINDRYRLQTLHQDTLARLMGHYEKAGRHEAALLTALRLLDQDSLREDAHRLVMRAHCRLGQRNAALEQYGRCREIVAGELDAEPVAATTQLYHDIRDGRFSIGPVPRSIATSPPVVRPQPVPGRNPLDVTAVTPLTGRDDELAFLQTCWQEARAGQLGLVLISGEAGVGKTRLVEAFAGRLRWQGARVLWGRCYEFERVLPYQPVAEAIRALLPALNAAELDAIPEWSLVEVARLAPELSEKRPNLAVPPAPASAQEQPRLFAGVTRFITNLSAHSPLLFVLEDLHWAGESTLQLIHYLARQLAGHPVLLLGAFRSDEVGRRHPLHSLRRPLAQAGLVQSLPLPRLSPTAVTSLVAQMSGAGEAVAPLAQRLYQETEGNPFFLVEMIKALFEKELIYLEKGVWRGRFDQVSAGELPLPDGVNEAVQARVRRLSDATQEAVGLAAVLGREFDFDLLHAVWGQGEEATLEALDHLLRRRLIVEGSGDLGRDYAFTHHKIQEVVYAALPRRRRRHLHARTGAAMESLYAAQAETMAGELAHHFRHGRQFDKSLTEKTITYLRLAGEQAAAQFANTEAVAYFGRALHLTPETDYAGRYALLLAREKVYAIQGEREAQKQDLASLKELAGNLATEQQAEVALRRAKYAQDSGDYPTAMAAARTAVDLAQAIQAEKVAAQGHLIWGQALIRRGEYSLAHSQYEQALTLARAGPSRQLEADILNNLGLVSYSQGDYVEAQVHYKQALHIFREIGDQRGQSASLNNLGVVAKEQGDDAAASAYYRQALHLHRKTGSRRGECLVLGNLGVIAAVQGEYDQARAYYEQSLLIAREIGHRLFEGNALLNLGNVSLYQGEHDEARSYYESALRLFRQIGNRPGESWGLAYLSLLSHRLGDDESALAYGRQAQLITQEIGDRLIQGYVLTHLGHALVGLGRFQEAAKAHREAVSVRRELGEPHLAMESLSGLARVYLRQNKLALARTCVEEILGHLETQTPSTGPPLSVRPKRSGHGLDGADEPFRVYLTCYHVLRANGDGRAPALLTTAHTLLQEQAAKISDEATRRSFLFNVPAHRELVAAFTDI